MGEKLLGEKDRLENTAGKTEGKIPVDATELMTSVECKPITFLPLQKVRGRKK